MKKWICLVCGFIYDEASGLPDEGIAPGTKWDDVPDDWMCPDCGVGPNPARTPWSTAPSCTCTAGATSARHR